MSTLIESPHDVIDRKERTMQVVNKARAAHAQIKGGFYNVPEFYPPTQIFVREGRDVQSSISRFLSRYVMRETATVKILENAITEAV